MEAPGLWGELRTSLRVIAPVRAEIRVEAGGGACLLVGGVVYAVKNAAESVQIWPKSVQV